MDKRKIGLGDLDRDVLISAPKKVKVYREGGWLMLSQDKVLEIVTEKRYTGDTLRVLLFFISMAEYDNRIRNYTQKKIAEKIKINQSKVSTAVKILEADKIIYKPDDETKEYYFSDSLLTKGTHKYQKPVNTPSEEAPSPEEAADPRDPRRQRPPEGTEKTEAPQQSTHENPDPPTPGKQKRGATEGRSQPAQNQKTEGRATQGAPARPAPGSKAPDGAKKSDAQQKNAGRRPQRAPDEKIQHGE